MHCDYQMSHQGKQRIFLAAEVLFCCACVRRAMKEAANIERISARPRAQWGHVSTAAQPAVAVVEVPP